MYDTINSTWLKIIQLEPFYKQFVSTVEHIRLNLGLSSLKQIQDDKNSAQRKNETNASQD